LKVFPAHAFAPHQKPVPGCGVKSAKQYPLGGLSPLIFMGACSPTRDQLQRSSGKSLQIVLSWESTTAQGGLELSFRSPLFPKHGWDLFPRKRSGDVCSAVPFPLGVALKCEEQLRSGNAHLSTGPPARYPKARGL
jgi:hypothetical protein